MRQFHFGIVHVQSSGSRGNILKEEEENRWKIFRLKKHVESEHFLVVEWKKWFN
jgi:hypothetical protein